MPIHFFLSFAKTDSHKVAQLKEHLTSLLRSQEIYDNLAYIYTALQEYEKAWEYICLAVAIIEKKLPETHPYRRNWVETKERIRLLRFGTF